MVGMFYLNVNKNESFPRTSSAEKPSIIAWTWLPCNMRHLCNKVGQPIKRFLSGLENRSERKHSSKISMRQADDFEFGFEERGALINRIKRG
jgi:hypothetical protein